MLSGTSLGVARYTMLLAVIIRILLETEIIAYESKRARVYVNQRSLLN